MSNYVWGSHLSYQDYTQAKKFVGDITGASGEAGRRVSMEVSQQTREIIASQEALAREQITVAEQSTHAMQEGFQTLSYGGYRHNAGHFRCGSSFKYRNCPCTGKVGGLFP